jgi:hypothetical protein
MPMSQSSWLAFTAPKLKLPANMTVAKEGFRRKRAKAVEMYARRAVKVFKGFVAFPSNFQSVAVLGLRVKEPFQNQLAVRTF